VAKLPSFFVRGPGTTSMQPDSIGASVSATQAVTWQIGSSAK
jgi:hypothetical protein